MLRGVARKVRAFPVAANGRYRVDAFGGHFPPGKVDTGRGCGCGVRGAGGYASGGMEGFCRKSWK